LDISLDFNLISSIDIPSIKATKITPIKTKTTPKNKQTGIQRGEVTHHQDQSIFPVSLSIKKIINRTPGKLSPEFEFFDAMIILIF
jgi:hypothetical protein